MPAPRTAAEARSKAEWAERMAEACGEDTPHERKMRSHYAGMAKHYRSEAECFERREALFKAQAAT